jgi:hypothetical protein
MSNAMNSTGRSPTEGGNQTLPLHYVPLYAQFGFNVFPVCTPDGKGGCIQHRNCKSPGKVPVVHKWSFFRSARTTDFMWRVWLEKIPAANIALVAGAISGVDVLDVEAEGLVHPFVQQLPVTPTQRSQRNGNHYFFRHVPGLKNRRWQDGEVHLGDFKTEGGYTVLAPSRGAIGQYLWQPGRSPADVPLADAPAWLVDFARPVGATKCAERRPPKSILDIVLPPPPLLPPGLASHVVNVIQLGLPKGQRSEGIATAVYALCSAGLQEPEIVSLILSSAIGEKAREKGSPVGWLLGRIESARAHIAAGSPNPAVLARIESVEEPKWNGRGWRVRFSLLLGEGRAAGKVIDEAVSTISDPRRIAAFIAATGLSDPWTHWRWLPGRVLRVTVREAATYGGTRVGRFFPAGEAQ